MRRRPSTQFRYKKYRQNKNKDISTTDKPKHIRNIKVVKDKKDGNKCTVVNQEFVPAQWTHINGELVYVPFGYCIGNGDMNEK